MPATPRHLEIAADIRARVDDGTLRPGDRLPTKRALAQQYGCSTQPVIKALEQLQYEGLLVGRQGVGVFVSERPGRETR